MKKPEARDPIRRSFYIYRWMLKTFEEIARKRNKSLRRVILEAFMLYISDYREGKV